MVELRYKRRYRVPMDSSDNARAFLIARDLITQHGDGVARFLENKIDALMSERDLEQLSVWFTIRNAVAIILNDNTTIQ